MTKQVGGNHYANEGHYGHWDWALDLRMPAMLYAATKYLDRLGAKGDAVEEINKSISYLKKWKQWLTLVDEEPRVGGTRCDREATAKYDRHRQDKWLHPRLTKTIIYMADNVLRRSEIDDMVKELEIYRDKTFTTIIPTGQENPFGYDSNRESEQLTVGDRVFASADFYLKKRYLLPDNVGQSSGTVVRVEDEYALVSWPSQPFEMRREAWLPLAALRPVETLTTARPVSESRFEKADG